MQKIRIGMVGGGPNAFIGVVHRMAAFLDGGISLVCGAFCRDPAESIAFGQSLGLETNRCYGDYEQMFAAEKLRPADQRMQFVVIVTPNNLHFPVARLALQQGFHVFSDKPATFNLAEALELRSIIEQTQRLYGLTHTYNGYPMVKEAKHRVAQGQLGTIRKITVEYSQGWLANANNDNSKQASWRLDPAQSGISCCIADIGIHAANLAEYISGLVITDVCAQLNTLVGDRQLDDDGVVMLKFTGQIPGVLITSQVATGEENNLNIRIYGDLASLQWSQEQPDSLAIKYADQRTELHRMGVGALAPATLKHSRTPAGHPQGYIEAFANLYQGFAEQVHAYENDASVGHSQAQAQAQAQADIPGIAEAIRGMQFIETVVNASQSDTKWHSLPALSHSGA